MAVKKSDLYGSIWKSCDELRGGMDASQYKDYVLILLFVKYVSDKYANGGIVEIPDGGSFADMVQLVGKPHIGDQMNKIIMRLLEANGLKGRIHPPDFNDDNKLGKGKDMIDRLSALVKIFDNSNLNFKGNRASDDDLLGDAYEYLMSHFATESGKSKGQFYTPAEVSRIIAKVIGIGSAKPSNTLYDPTCGSGSLLIKASDETSKGITIYGQEMDNSTASLAHMNMLMHSQEDAEIWNDNTLSAPYFTDANGNLRQFDFVVANPPFSYKSWTNGIDLTTDPRFTGWGAQPPQKNGDYAFLLHVIASLKSKGKGAIILPHGVLFRGNAEGTIRQAIINKGYIKGIIGLPTNLFYGTGIPACIIVLDKEGAHPKRGIFMIDASKGFVKDGNKNRLRDQDIHKIVDVFTNQREIPKYSRMVSYDDIQANDFNLNIPRYIDTSEPEDIHDIEAHLRGGIPNTDIDALEAYWRVFPSLKATLFEPERTGYSRLRVKIADIRQIITQHAEFRHYDQRINGIFTDWQTSFTPYMKQLEVGGHPNDFINTISEALISTFHSEALIDKYDVYQHLMTYWGSAMQDDVYMLVVDGWKSTTINPQGDFIPNTDLIPRELVIDRYFPDDARHIADLEAQRDQFISDLEQLIEAHAIDDGLLADARDDKGKLTQKSAKTRLKAIQKDPDASEERDLLEEAMRLFGNIADIKKEWDEATKALDRAVTSKYDEFTLADMQTLVVDDKWLATLSAEILGELDRVVMKVVARVKQLAERYAKPLPQLEAQVDELRTAVTEHLKKMGYSWDG
jgi:type I restriction enzyme M protein